MAVRRFDGGFMPRVRLWSTPERASAGAGFGYLGYLSIYLKKNQMRYGMARHSAVAQNPAMQASKFFGIAETAEPPNFCFLITPCSPSRMAASYRFGHGRNRRTENQASAPKNQAAQLTNCQLTNCQLTMCHMTICQLTICQLTICQLTNCQLTICHLTNCQFGGGGRADGSGRPETEGSHKLFIFLEICYPAAMSIFSLSHEPRRLQATEARLEAIYRAARKGLRGDSLALASGLLPAEYRQLCQFDPIAEMAELKGRADGEMEISAVLHEAALAGDAKAALEILKHQHGWVAKQQISVDVEQRISIIGALEMAQQRVIEGEYVRDAELPGALDVAPAVPELRADNPVERVRLSDRPNGRRKLPEVLKQHVA